MYLISLIAAGLVLLYVGLVAMLWVFQEQVVFQPPRGVAPSAVPARQVRYAAADGIELFAYVVGDCAPNTTVVLAFHGNADLARWLVPWATQVAEQTRSCVVLPEYRGYDGLAGVPTYEGSSHDARAALEFVTGSLNVASDDLVLYGHSLGTAVASELTTVVRPRSLLLESPFTSARAMAARMVVPGLTVVWALISRVHFDTMARVRSLAAPVWVAHGDRDIIIPVGMGQQVYSAAREKGELLIVAGAGHNDVARVGGDHYWTWIAHGVAGGRVGSLNPSARAETRSEP